MKKVLIISTHFAPDIHVGAKRPTKLCKYLPRNNWLPIVLTKQICDYYGRDDTLNHDIASKVLIERVKRWSISKQRNNGFKSNIGVRNNYVHNIFRNIKIKLLVNKCISVIFFYDYGWLIPGFLVAIKVIRKEKIDLIFSTSPNPEALIIGLFLKLLTGKPLICEYRDRWTNQPFIFENSIFHKKINILLERVLVKRSDSIIVVSELMKEALIGNENGQYNHKIHVIFNGYDKDDFKDVKNEESSNYRSTFNINYVGTWGQSTTPMFFLAALKELITKYKYLNNKIKVNFIGEVKWDPVLKDKIFSYIKDNHLEEVVIWEKYLPHKEALRYLLSADLLLLIVGIDKQKPAFYRYRVLAKLFEYLYVKKPIIALVPPDGETARIIRECNAGKIINPESVDKIASAIHKMYHDWRENKLHYNFNDREIVKYDREKQVKQLVDIFNPLFREM